MKNIWKNIERVGLILSILASGLALYISTKSCGDSSEALEMTKKEFSAKRFLILQSRMGNISPGFEFSTFDQNQKLQRMIIHLPLQFSEKELTIVPPEFYFDSNELQDSLVLILKRKIPEYKSNSGIQIRNISIPAIIVSNYVVAGEVLSDSALYHIEFDFRQEYFNNNPETQCEFKNLIFISRLSDESDFDKSLDEYWLEKFNGSLNTVEIN